MKKLLLLALVAVMTAPVTFAGDGSGTITSLMIGRSHGAKVFIKVSAAPAGRPACATNSSWHYVLALTDNLAEQQLSLLLTAYAAKTTVYLEGGNDCTVHSGIEDFRRVELR